MPEVNKADSKKFNKEKLNALNPEAKLALIRNATPLLVKEGGCALGLFTTIVMYYNSDKGYAFPNQEKLALEFGVQKRALARSARRLEELGLVLWLGGGHRNRANEYAPVFTPTLSDDARIFQLKTNLRGFLDPIVKDYEIFTGNEIDYHALDFVFGGHDKKLKVNPKRVKHIQSYVLQWMDENGVLVQKFAPPTAEEMEAAAVENWNRRNPTLQIEMIKGVFEDSLYTLKAVFESHKGCLQRQPISF